MARASSPRSGSASSSSKNPPAKYLAPAYGLLGTALENAKRPAEAADAFRNASKSADLEYLKARYLIDAGAGVQGGREAGGGGRGVPDGDRQLSGEPERDRSEGSAGGADRREDVTVGR